MSATTLSREFAQLVDAFGIGWDRVRRLTINAMKSAFLPFDERVRLLDEVIRPAYAELAG
jgi:adenosine deaminase